MNRFIGVIVAFAMLGPLSPARAQNAPPTPAAEFAPVGVTTVEEFGGGGFHQQSDKYLHGAQHRHRLCQRDHGGTARMCTSREILRAPSTAFGIGGWIGASDIGVLHNGKALRYFDSASGVVVRQAERLNCRQHLIIRSPAYPKATGLLLNEQGEITTAPCNELHPIVCCAQVVHGAE